MTAITFDKGVGICLMKKEQYHEKMNSIINLSQFEKYVKPRINAKDMVMKEEDSYIEVGIIVKGEPYISGIV